MGRNTVIAVFVGLLLLFGIIALVRAAGDDKPAESSTNTTDTANPPPDTRDDVQNPPDEDTRDAVAINGYAYAPSDLTIQKGTTVIWTNNDEVRHTVTPDEPSDAFKPSDLLGRGETYSFTFDTPGTYTYYCEPHPYMKARITVLE